MKNWIIIFIVSALVGFGAGYFIFQDKEEADGTNQTTTQEKESKQENVVKEESKDSNAPKTATTSDGGIFSEKGCISCHSVSALNIQGGATGPDLSKAYDNVEGKHGKPIKEFLKVPTSAVMSGVIEGNPLTDEEIEKIVEALKKAAEK
ncbi:cytochrome c551/c552 [Oikeobacillus pervagus]|uniref:Cytochrome c551/c552 n=1 Tax=Oikeobacillus pervagus TaxID=1325931 RepID=A0AAJ1WJM2_9BACI|nr:c-type cytochrome [Oikeobacillus pervagus]MDQ0215628.1 cytochrome c551/c552 [Oikeobacillus pervagus]